MKLSLPRCFRSRIPVLASGLALAVLPLDASSAQGQPATGWPHLKYAIYFTSQDVDSLLADQARFKKTMDYFAPVKAVHVYLEGAGRGDVNVPLLKKIADRLRAMGIRVSGAMVPVGQRGPSTYNNPEDMAALEKRMRSLAQVFDDIILDDWLFTTATDDKSVEDRGNRSWADYRTKLILEQAKKFIIGPAREVNPQARVIIKYPNWYEGHRDNGYDVYYEDLLFDKMAVGIETRDRMIHDQHIPIYSGYVFQKWWSGVDPGKWVGSWLDNYDMKGNANDYNAQVWQAVLAGSPEIILWCAGQLYPTNPSSDVYPRFVELLPEFDRVAGLLSGSPRGVPDYLPYGSTGEYNIFGYLGMAGIPQAPVAQFPSESKSAIFTLHSCSESSTGPDTMLAEKMIDRLRNGKDVFMTWGLWKKLRNTEFKNTLNLLDAGGSVTSDGFRIRQGWFRQELVKAARPFSFPRIETTTWPYVRDVAVVLDDYDYGVLLHVQYLKGNIYVLNMPDNSYDLLRLPAQALNAIRRPFHEELGVELDGPGGVALYMYGAETEGSPAASGQYVLYNMSDETAPMKLRFTRKVPTAGWKELVRGEDVRATQDTTLVRFRGPAVTEISISLKPFRIAVLQAK
ncbi:MAG TPA: hypothetical protein VK569_00140 [Bacteroidota bacterium]|nr:hypothetical protein [Bacteroidota bacterium]